MSERLKAVAAGHGASARAIRLALTLCAALTATAAPAATLFTGAKIHPVSSAPIDNGQLLIDGERIVAVGTDLSAQAAGAERVDLSGRWVVPAFIAANTVMGLTEIETVRGSVDMAETGAINPNARAQVAVNPDSELLPVARANGVLYAHVVPQVSQGGVIAGQSALIRMDGWTWEEMTLAAPVGVHLMWPSTRLPPFLPAPMREEAIKGAARSRELIEQAFDDAAAYDRARAAGTADGTDARWEAMRPVLAGKTPLFIHAIDLQQIREALDFTQRRGLQFTLVGGQDAWRVADVLKARGVPVILHTPFELPLRRHEGVDTAYANAGKLAAAGIPLAIASDASGFAATLERNLPYAAAAAVAYGLPWDQGLRAITLTPAELLGVSDRLGSLEPGKTASFLVSDGDPLDVRSEIVAAWLDGQPVDLSSKHTRLRDKYEGKYRDR
ncbi:MAG: amidohydrolase family protein [Rhodanobacteraceae bacterium]|nr:amidohydrolase family protein [Rhodanobacteraceae bacterium]